MTFLAILLLAAMLATVAALVYGVVMFLKNSSEEVHGNGPSQASLKSNKAMQFRIFFQAATILIVVVILFVAGQHG
ncbi:twin transmembrane helix small protein [Sphingomonas bacterium]|uniref:twin transmembrane helix small protein n=1 Tax=Sphingomonas bacterium TaxID=1895847 RepID=UPI0026035707|nr:twin transmembrane helix small protein [Sphingomonas bacterium]MDB5677420.1 hypothetical protein [Sphingomonas bacterium]